VVDNLKFWQRLAERSVLGRRSRYLSKHGRHIVVMGFVLCRVLRCFRQVGNGLAIMSMAIMSGEWG
jgi:hypothetical protein